MILSDNTIPKEGEVGAPDPKSIDAVCMYAYNQVLATDPRLDSVILPTIVGEKGRVDGLGFSIVR